MHHRDYNAHQILAQGQRFRSMGADIAKAQAARQYKRDMFLAHLTIVIALFLTFGIFGEELALIFNIPLK